MVSQNLAWALNLPSQGVLAIVGAGGKTTAMYVLARELVNRGQRVLCTTTTKIYRPHSHEARLILKNNNPQWLLRCQELARSHQPLCLGAQIKGSKVWGIDPTVVNELVLRGIFDWIIIEADGARGRPLKAPANHEPVIPKVSTHVLGLVGLQAVGQPLGSSWVYNSQGYAQLTNLPLGATISAQSVAYLIGHEHGLFKNLPPQAQPMLCLNQADLPHAREYGREILQLLHAQDRSLAVAVLTVLQNNPFIWEPS